MKRPHHPLHAFEAKEITDDLGAITAPRSTLATDLGKPHYRRAGDVQTALRVLSVERDQLNTDQLPAINVLTALVSAHDLGIDAPQAAERIADQYHCDMARTR